MIRARIERPSHPHGPLVLLGVDERNVQRLRQGQPIYVDLSELLPGVRAGLAIHYGQTLTGLADELDNLGFPMGSAERQRLAELDADQDR